MSRVALLIGVNHYHHDLLKQQRDRLKPADDDVKAVQRVLSDPSLGAFDEVESVLTVDSNQMLEKIASFAHKLALNDVGLLFLSGYGIKDEQGSLYFAIPRTCFEHGRLQLETTIPADFVRKILNRSRSKKQVLILDCWFSSELNENAIQDSKLIDLQEQLGANSRLVLTSATSVPQHYEVQPNGTSLYTYYLLEGIETGAADSDGDGMVSARELHHYAKDEIQKKAPHLTPCLIAPPHDNFDIPLAHAVDPKQKYQEQVRLLVKNGTVSTVGREHLNWWREKLKLTPAIADKLEEQILRPHRIKADQIQRYRDAAIRTIPMDYSYNDAIRKELQELQQLLELTDEEVAKIEPELHPLAKQNLDNYEKEYLQAIRQEGFSLSVETSQRLERLQQDFKLTDEQVSKVQENSRQQIIYQQKLQHYQREFEEMLANASQLSDAQAQELRNLQADFNLQEIDVIAIEQLVKQKYAEKQQYQQKLTQYEQAFRDEIQSNSSLSDESLQKLNQLQQDSQLKEEDVVEIQKRIDAEIEANQKAYQENLNDYATEFSLKVKLENPLTEATKEYLHSYQQQLGLKDEDVRAIEDPILAEIEADRQAEEQKQAEERKRAEEQKQAEAQKQAEEQKQAEAQNQAKIQPIEEAPKTKLENDLDPDSYIALENHLERKHWQDADRETFNLLLTAAKQFHIGRLDEDAIRTLPEPVLQTIDRLWQKYSDGKFGFSVQKKIYSELTDPVPERRAISFAQKVGWLVSGIGVFKFFKYYNLLDFNPKAPRGQFPAYWYWKIPFKDSIRAGNFAGRGGGDCDHWMLAAWMNRLERVEFEEQPSEATRESQPPTGGSAPKRPGRNKNQKRN